MQPIENIKSYIEKTGKDRCIKQGEIILCSLLFIIAASILVQILCDSFSDTARTLIGASVVGLVLCGTIFSLAYIGSENTKGEDSELPNFLEENDQDENQIQESGITLEEKPAKAPRKKKPLKKKKRVPKKSFVIPEDIVVTGPGIKLPSKKAPKTDGKKKKKGTKK